MYKDIDLSLSKTKYNDINTKIDGDAIRQAIKIIINTPIGSLRCKPSFGSNVHKLLFEKIGPLFRIRLKQEIESALSNWEPRVAVKSIDVDESGIDENYLNINIIYTILTLKYEDNLTIQLEKRS